MADTPAPSPLINDHRFGGVGTDGWKPFGGTFIANQTATAAKLAGLAPGPFGWVEWLLVTKSGVTAATLRICRVVKLGPDYALIQDEAVSLTPSGDTVSRRLQQTDGQPVYAYVNGITSGGEDLQLWYRFFNRP